MIGQTSSQILQKTEQETKAKVPANLQPGFQRALAAALNIMYDNQQLPKMMAGIQQIQDPVQGAARGAANLFGVLMHQSKSKIPMSIASPVAVCVMCEFLDLMEKAGKIKVTPDIVAQATQETIDNILKMIGASQGQIQQMAQANVANHQSSGQPNQAQPPAQQSGIIASNMQGA